MHNEHQIVYPSAGGGGALAKSFRSLIATLTQICLLCPKSTVVLFVFDFRGEFWAHTMRGCVRLRFKLPPERRPPPPLPLPPPPLACPLVCKCDECLSGFYLTIYMLLE